LSYGFSFGARRPKQQCARDLNQPVSRPAGWSMLWVPWGALPLVFAEAVRHWHLDLG
jgi:hypothetical protein